MLYLASTVSCVCMSPERNGVKLSVYKGHIRDAINENDKMQYIKVLTRIDLGVMMKICNLHTFQ